MPRAGRWLLFLAFLPACSKQATDHSVTAEVPTETKSASDSPSATERFTQPFAEAVTTELVDDQLLPPDRTVGGKVTATMRESVEQLWPKIALTDAGGKPLPLVVTLETDEGPIAIELRADLAPNHVRNFLALVKLGFYDGLRFDRIVRQEGILPDNTKVHVELLKAGCPAGTGDPGIGHIGYHLKPEFTDTKHEAGTVGMLHDLDPNSAGVRFYIALGPSPVLDGNFTVIGKVTKGLDTVKKIAVGKIVPPEQDPTRELLERPIVIKKAIAEGDGSQGK